MGLPKKISQLPLNNNIQPEDLLVTVNQNDVTTKIRLDQVFSFIPILCLVIGKSQGRMDPKSFLGYWPSLVLFQFSNNI